MLTPISDRLTAEGARSAFEDLRSELLTLCHSAILQGIPNSAMLLTQVRLDLGMIRRPETTEHAVIHKALRSRLPG